MGTGKFPPLARVSDVRIEWLGSRGSNPVLFSLSPSHLEANERVELDEEDRPVGDDEVEKFPQLNAPVAFGAQIADGLHNAPGVHLCMSGIADHDDLQPQEAKSIDHVGCDSEGALRLSHRA